MMIMRTILLTLLLGPALAMAQEQSPTNRDVGVVTHLSGTLTARQPDGVLRILARASIVREGEVLTSERETYARIKFIDSGEVILRPATRLTIRQYRFNQAAPQDDRIALEMVKGGLRAISGLISRRSKESVSFTTPTATIGIRGTDFSLLQCVDGYCDTLRASGAAGAKNGFYASVLQGEICVDRVPEGSAPPDPAQMKKTCVDGVFVREGEYLFKPAGDEPASIQQGSFELALPNAVIQNDPLLPPVDVGMLLQCILP